MKKILFMILVVMVALASCDVMPQISDIDGDGIADELDNLDDRLVGTWTGTHPTWIDTLILDSNGKYELTDVNMFNTTIYVGTWNTDNGIFYMYGDKVTSGSYSQNSIEIFSDTFIKQ
jgi:hypothetical protein